MKTTDEDQLKILDEVPSSAVEMQVKDKVDFGNPILFLCLSYVRLQLSSPVKTAEVAFKKKERVYLS